MNDRQLAKWLEAQLAQTQSELARDRTHAPRAPSSQQYKDPAAKTGAYWQLSYTHNMRSRSR